MNYGDFLGKQLKYKGVNVVVRAMDSMDKPNITLMTDKNTLIELDWEQFKEWIDGLISRGLK